MNQILIWIIFLGWFKHIIGFHFSWETCQCCGKKYRDHKKPAVLPKKVICPDCGKEVFEDDISKWGVCLYCTPTKCEDK